MHLKAIILDFDGTLADTKTLITNTCLLYTSDAADDIALV